MEAIADYVLRLTCGAVLCSLILSITGTAGSGGRLRQTLCALFLAFLAISPLRSFDPEDIHFPALTFSEQAQELVQEGQEQAQSAFSEIISEQYTSYILSRAAELSLSPEVMLHLDPDTGQPLEVTLTGTATPYEKTVLTDYIHQTLGVERSSIHWKP